ncbi:MAG: type 4a pilus biogenesis protein PilO, partial [Persicimonas sp.]
YLVLSPIRTDYDNAKDELSKLEQEQERLERLKENQERMRATIRELHQEMIIAGEKLPRDAEIPSLLQRVHNQAQTAGLDINNFQRRSEQSQEHYIEIPVTMELEGSFDELANFFYYIGRMTRIVNVQNLSMSRRADGIEEDGELKVTAEATTFQMKDGAPNEE